MATEPEIEDVTTQPDPAADAAKELGGKMDESNVFRPDFDSVIDDTFQKMAAKGHERAAEIVKGGEAGAVTGPAGATGAADAGQSGATAATGPAEGQTGPTGAQTGPTGAQSGPTGAATGATGPDDRDKDLTETAAKLGDLEKRPKTKAIITEFQEKIVTERNLRGVIEKECTALRAEIEALKKLPVPKEVDEELKALRATVQELDASRDPAIKAKFDTKIEANENRILSLLKEHGYGLDKDGKEVAGAVDALKKSGLSRRTLQATIEKLEKSGDGGAIEAAEELKDILRENSGLSKQKDAEIANYRAGAEERTKTEKAEIDRQVKEANEKAGKVISELAAKYDFLKTPADPKPEDSVAVRAEKERARVAHNERVNRWNEAIRKETSSPTDANITARAGLLLRECVVPQLQSQLEAARKDLATAQEQIKAMKGAGNLSQKINSPSANRPAPKEEGDASEGYDNAVDAAARKLGLIK